MTKSKLRLCSASANHEAPWARAKPKWDHKSPNVPRGTMIDPVAVEFNLNGIPMQKKKEELPMSTEALVKLAEILPTNRPVPGYRDARVVATVTQQGGGFPNILELEADLSKFWEDYSGSKIQIDLQHKLLQQRGSGRRRTWFDSGFGILTCLGLLLALFTGSSFGLLPHEWQAAVKMLRKNFAPNFAPHDPEAPAQQMVMFAEATVAATRHSEDGYLDVLFMEDARSFFSVDNMETSAKEKVQAVNDSLQSTNIPENISANILSQIKHTKALTKQFHDFFLDTHGRALLFSVNIWMQQKKGTDNVEIALMLCGSEFTQALPESPVEVDEVQYEEVTTKAKRWWTGWEEIIVTKRPTTIDGKNPLKVKMQRQITDPKKMRPTEVQQMKDYLVSLASKSMLQNSAPHKLPTSSERLAPVGSV